ncbi:hypothetical protein [Actinomadura violacea]|uniref:Uncharacterized protein n=1 Tax=Actinomadura violacea TaxID=2819934 RepID=A0ABS3RXL1_9ACTN|nr:hypothetical protein [Actinomadura violacea]MBO2461501.1 hypothetical protein [Actinomadura violacea]
MMYELKHSPLRLPHGRLRVTGKTAHRTHDGEAFAATVQLDKEIVGTIENEGTGGETRFIPGPPASAISERIALWNQLVAGAEFARASVTRLRATDSGKVPAEYVADALVTEYETSTWLAAIGATGQGGVRSFDPSLGLSTTYIPYGAPAGYKAAHDRALVEQLKTQELEEGDIWQVWTGEAWKDLTEAPATDEGA